MFEQNITLGPGTGTFTQHTLEIIIMLLGAFLIGLWLGWALWSKYKQQIDKMSLENQSNLATAEALRNELTALKSRLATAESDRSGLSVQVDSINRDNVNLLQEVEALEKELSELKVHNRQLDTELGLSHAPDVPASADLPLEIELPIAVPEVVVTDEAANEPAPTSAMAENRPQALVIEPVAFVEPQPEKKKSSKKAEAEPPVAEPVISAAAADRDDLTVVEGIGPKIQLMLNQYGIYTYRQLAETEVDRLKEILATAGPQLAMHDPGTWPSQANLAANDQWDTLKSVQGFLKGGKKPT